jgi:hypothetical protein
MEPAKISREPIDGRERTGSHPRLMGAALAGDRRVLDPDLRLPLRVVPLDWTRACPLQVIPGARPVEEPIPQGDTFHLPRVQHARFQLRISPRAQGHTRAGVDRQASGLISEAAARLKEKAARPAGCTGELRTPSRRDGGSRRSTLSLRSPGAAAAISDGFFGEGRQLVDDDLGSSISQSLLNGSRIESAHLGVSSSLSARCRAPATECVVPVTSWPRPTSAPRNAWWEKATLCAHLLEVAALPWPSNHNGARLRMLRSALDNFRSLFRGFAQAGFGGPMPHVLCLSRGSLSAMRTRAPGFGQFSPCEVILWVGIYSHLF